MKYIYKNKYFIFLIQKNVTSEYCCHKKYVKLKKLNINPYFIKVTKTISSGNY